jgi:hypothetical protein
MEEANWLRFGVTVAALIRIASVLPPETCAPGENVKNPNIPRTRRRQAEPCRADSARARWGNRTGPESGGCRLLPIPASRPNT